MKELSIEEKAKAYEELIERLKDLKFAYRFSPLSDTIEEIFPELKESENEKIRKAIHIYLDWLDGRKDYAPRGEYTIRDMIAFLERQSERKPIVPKFRIGDIITPKDKNEHYTITDIVDEWYEFREKHINGGIPIHYQDNWELVEQKPVDKIEHPKFKVGDKIKLVREPKYPAREIIAIQYDAYYFDETVYLPFSRQDEWELVGQNSIDKIKPKFKVGDWVVHDMSDDRKAIRQIVNMTNKSYVLDGEDFNTFYFDDLENNYHLWTIQDAKDGNVLFTSSTASHETFIFKSIDEKGNAKCYFAYDSEDGFREGKYHFIGRATDCKPTTKEQRDLLFKKMHEAGYKWNADTLTLEKIEKPSTIKFNEPDIDAMVEEYWNNEDRLISSHTRAMIEEAYRQGLEDMYKRLSRKIKEVNNEREL